jgi:hypothetical protein
LKEKEEMKVMKKPLLVDAIIQIYVTLYLDVKKIYNIGKDYY